MKIKLHRPEHNNKHSNNLRAKGATFLKRLFFDFFSYKKSYNEDFSELHDLMKESDEIKAHLKKPEKIIDALIESSAEHNKRTIQSLEKSLKKIQKEQDSRECALERIVQEIRNDYAKYTSSSKQFQYTVIATVDAAVGTISGVNSALSGIRSYLDENSKILKRFEEGYDYQILKNFIRQIIRIIDNFDKKNKNIDDEDASNELKDGRDDLMELLERNGIEKINPEIGLVYAGNEKYIEVSQEKEKTDEASKSGHIAAVERVGYIYKFNEGQERVIQAARVKLFK